MMMTMIIIIIIIMYYFDASELHIVLCIEGIYLF